MSRNYSCPTCGNSTVHRFNFEKNHCRIYTCTECGIGRTEAPSFSPESYYTDSYFSGGHDDGYADYVGSEAILRSEFARTVSMLMQYIKPGARVLELGCAYGFFLLEARKHFEAEGIEISTDAADYARERGLSVKTGLADSATMQGIGDVDAVVLLDVIEHLPDPYETLSLCWNNLRPGGIILFTTGDFGTPLAKLLGPRWRLMTPPQHLFFFTRKSVEVLASRLGAEVARYDHPWKIVPLNLALYQLPRILGFSPPKTAPTFGNGWGIPANLFDAMRVVLRKPA